ncbi:YueI family protein [Bacillus sp. FJAT-29790]|uniref:YueI family protein n=1 Tax=Bacillus sp. FJAT-29790 TaxID=1895002 RepID=UPI001C244CCE|nr:YueI family protein [Bacillus sp. FJAT-29790]
MSKNIDDYIQQGIHGQKETNPDERRKFLGTLRERIVIALTQSQVREPGIYKQVEDALKGNRKARLYLNGNMSYSELSKYTKQAAKNKIEYTMVTNKDHNSDIGLVLAYDYAIDKEEIYVKKESPKKTVQKGKGKKGVFTIFSKVFKRGRSH